MENICRPNWDSLTCDFQLPLAVPVVYMLLVTFLVVIPLVTKPAEAALGLAIVLGTAIPYYVIVIMWTNKPKYFNKIGYYHFIATLARDVFRIKI